MYTLVIADDEKMIRDGLTNIVDWEELGFEIAAALGDGEEVIEYLDSMPVDVILTDIKMVHLSGIDIARHVQEAGFLCKVVFISGYKEFELARQGIRYGVEDYILKPSKVEDITSVFTKIRQILDERKRDAQTMEQVKMQWEEAQQLLEEKFVNGLVMGVLNDRKEIERRMHLLYPDIDVLRCPCAVANLELMNYETFIRERWNYGREQFEDALRHFFGLFREEGVFHIIYKSGGRMKLFLILRKQQTVSGLSPKSLEEQLSWLTQRFEDIFGLEIRVEVISAWETVYQIADEQESILGQENWQEETELYLQEQKKLVMSNIMSANINTAQTILLNMLKNMRGREISYSGRFLVELFADISNFLSVNNPALYSVVKPFIHYTSILDMSTEAEMAAYCGRVLTK